MAPSHRQDAFAVCLGAALLAGLAALLFTTNPEGDAAPAGSGRRLQDDALTIRIAHDGAGCGRPCRADAHWSVRVRNQSLTDPAELRKVLQAEADGARKDPARPKESERQVVITGGEDSPWGLVQRVINECAKVGIYKIDWSVPERGIDAPLVPAWLPRQEELGGIRCGPVKDEIRVFLKWDPSSGESLRKIGNRGMVDSDEHLMSLVFQYVNDFKKAGRTSVPIVIDATPDVPWKDVLHVMDLSREEKATTIEFAAPFPEIERPKKK